MACFYCQHVDGINNPDNGDCVECKRHVCIDPPVRNDKKFHATLCQCHCQDLVCRYDAARHASTHHQVATDCFPSAAIAASTALLTAAIAEAHAGRVGLTLESDAVDTFNEFLNFTAPGREQLRGAFARSRETQLSDVAEVEKIAETHDYLRFRPEFYSSGTIDKLVALAGQTLMYAWARGDIGTRTRAQRWINGDVREQLDASYLNGDEPRYSERFLEAFIGPRMPKIPAAIVRALRDTAAPRSADEIADWIVSARELTVA